MNSVRLLAMESPYPFDQVAPGGALAPEKLRELTRQIGVSAWMGAGAIYGCKEVNKGVVQVVMLRLGRSTARRAQDEGADGAEREQQAGHGLLLKVEG